MIQRLIAATILMGTLLAPAASAHLTNFSDTRTFTLGEYSASLDIQPSPIYANSLLTLTLTLSTTSTGQIVIPKTEFALLSPAGNESQLQARSTGTGWETTAAIMESGNHTITIRVQDAEGPHETTTWFVAYPDIPYRITPYDAAQDVYTGYPTQLVFRVVNQTSLTTAPELTDLVATFEHWDDAHTKILDSENYTLQPGPEQTWMVKRSFEKPGMYHVRFSSRIGHFNADDVPLLHTYATAAPAGMAPAPGANKTPSPAPISIIIVIATLAIITRRRE